MSKRKKKDFPPSGQGKGGQQQGGGGRPPVYKGQDPKEVPSVKQSDVINDYSYYVDPSKPLTEQVYNYSFKQFMGVPFKLSDSLGYPHNYALDGIMQIRLNPSAGFTRYGEETNAGANMAGRRTHTILTARGGRKGEYTYEDTTLLILALGNIFAHISHGTRVLGIMEQYNSRNRLFPKSVVQAAGFDFDDLAANYAVYRKQFNLEVINAINELPIPGNINYLKKQTEMFQGIYLDEDGSDMAQLYVLVPDTHWVFDEAYSPTGSGLKTKKPLNYESTSGFQTQTFADYMTDVKEMIGKIYSSKTFDVIFQDILRCSSQQGLPLMRIGQVPETYIVQPSKVEELSMWINNLTALGSPLDATQLAALGDTISTPDNDVVNDVNILCVVHRPKFTLGTTPLENMYPIINFKHSDPTVEEKVLSTRLMMCGHFVQASDSSWYTDLVALPDWYPVYIATSNGNAVASCEDGYTWGQFSNNLALKHANCYSKFDWHPYLVDIGSAGIIESVLGDTQYFTTMDYELLKSMHDNAMLEELTMR